MIEVRGDDERTVEQATALLRANGYRIVGRVVGGKVVLVGVRRGR